MTHEWMTYVPFIVGMDDDSNWFLTLNYFPHLNWPNRCLKKEKKNTDMYIFSEKNWIWIFPCCKIPPLEYFFIKMDFLCPKILQLEDPFAGKNEMYTLGILDSNKCLDLFYSISFWCTINFSNYGLIFNTTLMQRLLGIKT